ncbi:hypothetical protein FIU97_07550 [Roseivivax sp. THAF40]|uniref:hypothetical protein n=1 Tax=unclassified Roseivivax TaxID=2639302 RepID=UPI0012679262|nr:MULTISPECIES: hypothetical protein [unclassified Roseivivax]QFS82650.1 hypothetical protein FIV09_07445 [Roseivivax sp. THAF197b]QFT46419.1 hypothetical protein FIU97_07550 [Roseivivax sp. THAF40]
MFVRVLTAAALAVSLPALAAHAQSSVHERFAKELGLNPANYTLNQIVQIREADAADGERKARIAIIDRQNQAFRDRVLQMMQDGAPQTVTRAAN